MFVLGFFYFILFFHSNIYSKNTSTEEDPYRIEYFGDLYRILHFIYIASVFTGEGYNGEVILKNQTTF